MLTRPARNARTLLAAALTLLAVGLLGGLTAAPASAHARWLGSDPAEGSTVVGLPAAVVMTYSEEISPQFVDTAVVPPGGEPVPTPASVAGTDVTIDLSAVAAGDVEAGTWQVVSRVVSADGHPVEHTTSLVVELPAEPSDDSTVEAAAPEPTAVAGDAPTSEPATSVEPSTGQSPEPVASRAEPSTTATTVGSDPLAAAGLPVWAGVLLAVVVVAAGGTAAVLAIRRRPPSA